MDMDLPKALTAAFELPIIYDSFQPELGKPMEIQWDGFPDRTLHKLEVMARVQFWAAVTLLRATLFVPVLPMFVGCSSAWPTSATFVDTSRFV
jgi:hypothetical protein